MNCKNCGAPLQEGATFCTVCGTSVENENAKDLNYSADGTFNSQQTPYVSSRNIGLAIFLSIITCGLYGIYWFIKITDEMNDLTGDFNATSGGMAFLFSLITCGFYSLYWAYKMGCKMDDLTGKSNHAIMFVLFSLFGLAIVDYAIIQDTINMNAQ